MSIIDTILTLAPAIGNELTSIVNMIVGSKDPLGSIAKAKRVLEMDALDAATDAGLDAALKKLHGK